MHVHPFQKPKPRRGSILVIVLIGLLVASMLGLGLLKTVLIHHRQTRVLSDGQQGFWLAEAGIQRAIRELTGDPAYEGETWEVPAEKLGGSRTAKVTIQVAGPENETRQREICVRVELDDGRAGPVGFQREYRYARFTR